MVFPEFGSTEPTAHHGVLRIASCPVVHDFQETTPLLAFTKYKMHGLTTIGPSLLFQQNLLKAMVAKIQDTIGLVRDRIDSSDSVGCY